MDFVDFNLSKKLKEKGFREKCLLHYESTGGFYSNSIDTYDKPNQVLDYSDFLKCFNDGNSIGLIDVPTISQVLKWLREEHNLYVSPQFITFGAKEIYNLWNFSIIDLKNNALLFPESELYSDYYKDYEQAALAGIEYVLNNLI